ncbi:MAG TPA: IS1595 family transposase [Vicinamibacterales bacterium]|nr:IS1595 family transposase [Vicinamibacterales bacterium]
METPRNWSQLGPYFADEDKARLLLEAMRWPNGPTCPQCKQTSTVYRMQPRKASKTPGRKGLLRCRACKRQFTVTTGTVFEDSHIPMTKWLQAIYLITASKKGMSAHQLHRMLGLTYKAAWFMGHRLRYAMSVEPFGAKLSGIVEMDETFVGGKVRFARGAKAVDWRNAKTAVVGLVERGGRVRAFPMERITAETLGAAISEHVAPDAIMMTDELPAYRKAVQGREHQHTTHYNREYVRGNVHSNTVEGFFSLLKRGITGVYHHVGKGHLSKYCDEFSFRYDARKVSDADRAELLVWGAEGKRLTYKQPGRASQN